MPSPPRLASTSTPRCRGSNPCWQATACRKIRQHPTEDIEEISLTALSEGTEVKEEILDQAEVFVAHGHANLAIHMLQQHLRQAPDESPMPWLLLLDLLRREGDEAAYAAASDECQRHFNINLAAHPMARDLDDSHGLENYPHLLEMLTHAWNTPAIDALFDDLIYDQRGGTRLGFEPGAYRDILLLRDIAQQKTLAMAA
jgi:CheY-like chemotaxis protein